MVTVISEDQAAAFGILRRDQIATDLLPEERWEAYARGRIGQFGLNPGLARRAETPLGNVWVIPGEGWMCLSVAASPDPSSLDGGGLSCNAAHNAITRGLITWTGSRSGRGQMVQGLVPDAIVDVTLIAANGSTTHPRITDNVYGADLGEALAQVCFDGQTILKLGFPDG